MGSPDISGDAGEGMRVSEVPHLRLGQNVMLEHIDPETGKTYGEPIEGPISGARHGSSPVCEGHIFSVPKRGPVPFRATANSIYQITEDICHIYADVCVFRLTILGGETANNPIPTTEQPEELVSIPLRRRSTLEKIRNLWRKKPATDPPTHGLSIHRP